jgi:hypothetical protein
MRDDGYLILSFPPFYSTIGVTSIAPFHLFGQELAIRMARKRKIYRNIELANNKFDGNINSFSNAFGNWDSILWTD